MQKKTSRNRNGFILLLCIFIVSCSNIDFNLPQGPQGPNGKSAFDIWKEEVNAGNIKWPSDKTTVADFLVYIKGEKGDKGEDGMSAYQQWKSLIEQGNVPNPHDTTQRWPASDNTEADFWNFLTGRDGQTPHVGKDGKWYIGNQSTGINAVGKDGINGKDGLSSYELWKKEVTDGHINWPSDEITMNHFFLYLKGKDGKNGLTPHVGINGHWFIGNQDTGVAAKGDKGDNGNSPYIGSNGNWWIGNTDTQIKAQGDKGETGLSPVIKDGYWWIGTSNTGIRAQGAKGDKGDNGLTPVIKNGNWWIGNTDTGLPAKGPKGDKGDKGISGSNGISPHIGKNGNWWIGTTDTGIKARGDKGADGASAYELWVDDVNNGRITDKNNQPWDKTRITMADFYDYLSGTNGKSAYELWKETVATGNVDNPKEPGQKWPVNNITEADFYDYLTGKNGINGTNGLSAYELWKQDLAKRCNTPEALRDHRTDTLWDCNMNSINDFYDFLRGKDGKNGKDGEDGRPGEMGKPGAEVVIIRGIPNVIAQYSQSEFGEYVRTTDGGVLYKVYNEEGQLAPGAIVKGMPGIAPDKTYTANEEGEFIVPKEDLPNIQSIDQRWGSVSEVTIPGKAPKVSAKNTYVPNRIYTRIILRKNLKPYLNEYQYITFDLQRKVNPDDEWQNLPSYLPNNINKLVNAYRVSDKTNPQSIVSGSNIFMNSYSSITDNSYYIYNYVYRYMKENHANIKGSQNEYWDGTDIYYTVKSRGALYGDTALWNGTAFLPPYQIGPSLKKLKLKTVSGTTDIRFDSAEGEFDYSNVDFNIMYKYYARLDTLNNGVVHVTHDKYSVEEAKALQNVYISFIYTSTVGNQESGSGQNKSSFNNPTFKVLTPYVNSYIKIRNTYNDTNVSTSGVLYRYYEIGKLYKRADSENQFYVQMNSGYTFPEVEVTYEE